MQTIKNLKALQEHLFQILLEVTDFFDKNEIDYSLYAGTLLGAVRHKGFIPWDDDIDILMTEDNFKKLLQLSARLPEHLKLQSKDTDPTYELEFAKIRDERTVIVEKDKEQAHYKFRGLFIDIFVLRGYTKEGNQLCSKVDILRKRIMRLNRLRKGSLKRRLCVPIKFFTRFELNRLNKTLESNYRTYNFDQTAQMSLHENNYCPFFTKSLVFPTEKKYLFNGKLFRGPKDANAILEPIFGNYMVIPKEEDRPKGHVIEFYVKED